jgi:drug/metabolite transporter (DMT)-like permease
MRIKDIGNSYLVLALVLGSLVPVMLKIASQNINIYEYLLITYLVAVPASFIYILARGKLGRLIDGIRNVKEFAFIALLGLLNYGMLEYGLTYAEKFVSASLATVVYRTFPILMLIFLPVMLRERISKYQIIALLLGFAGIYIAVTGGSLSVFSHSNGLIIGLIIAVALASAFVSVAIKKYSFDMEIAMFMFNLATLVFFAALFFAVRAPMQPINGAALMSILYVGIIYNVFVGLMYYGALRMIKTTFVTNIYFLSPFLTFIFSWIMLGEQIYFYYIAIAVLVAVGLAIQKFDKLGGTYTSKDKALDEYVFHDVTSAFINTDVPLLYNVIKSGGRVLAVKVAKDYYKNIRGRIRGNYGNHGNAFIYTDGNRRLISSEQCEFVKDIMGAETDEMVLMSAGVPHESERALSGILSYKQKEQPD